MAATFEKTISAVLGLAAVAIATVMVHREFFAPPSTNATARPSEYLASWKEILPAGHSIGDVSGSIKLIVFTDLECPFCRRFNETVKELLGQYPQGVEYVFVHRPIQNHRFALSAARAAECADRDGRFADAVNRIYAAQDSFGLKSWNSFARDAGVQDSVLFKRCMADSTAMPKVTAGLALAEKFKITATPTVILNGWKYGIPPSDTSLVRAVKDLLAGRSPYPGFPKSAIIASSR